MAVGGGMGMGGGTGMRLRSPGRVRQWGGVSALCLPLDPGLPHVGLLPVLAV